MINVIIVLNITLIFHYCSIAMNTMLRSMCRASGLASKLCRLSQSNVPNLIPTTLRHSVATIPQARQMSSG